MNEETVIHEIHILHGFIKKLGSPKDGKTVVTFGQLFDDYELANTLESLAGTLKAGKRRKFWHYGPELLLQGLSDKVEITMLRENIDDEPSAAPVEAPKPQAAQPKPRAEPQQPRQEGPKPVAEAAAPAANGGGVISAACSDCGREHRLRQEMAGKKIRCKGCNAAFTVVAQ